MSETVYQFQGTDDYIINDDLMLTMNIAIKMNKREQERQRWLNQ